MAKIKNNNVYDKETKHCSYWEYCSIYSTHKMVTAIDSFLTSLTETFLHEKHCMVIFLNHFLLSIWEALVSSGVVLKRGHEVMEKRKKTADVVHHFGRSMNRHINKQTCLAGYLLTWNVNRCLITCSHCINPIWDIWHLLAKLAV